MGLVDHQPAAVVTGQPRQLPQRRQVAVHREDPVGDDQRGAPLGLAQPPGEVLDVAVAVDEGLGPGEATAVDDAGVVELVGEDRLARPGEGRDRAGIRQVAGAEEQRRLVSLEAGQPLLQPAVGAHVA